MKARGVGVPTKTDSRRGYVVAAGVVVMAAIVLVMKRRSFAASSNFPAIVDVLVKYLPLALPAIVIFGVILYFEYRNPVRSASITGGRGRGEDIVWMLLAVPVTIFGTFWFSRGLKWIWEQPLSGISVDLGAYLPYVVVFLICLVIGDFLDWISHYLKHKVPLFWRFHEVHHSAIDLSVFSGSRVHLGEAFITRASTVIPFFMIGGNLPMTVAGYALVHLWYSRLQHANVRLHFGPLRHVFVSPQYHRMHHSIEPGDIDKNFAGMFPIWDRLFGTQVDDRNRFPDSGINDPEFPRARSRNPIEILRAYVAQTVYPLRTKSRSMADNPT